jgi:hypothetical protein
MRAALSVTGRAAHVSSNPFNRSLAAIQAAFSAT